MTLPLFISIINIIHFSIPTLSSPSPPGPGQWRLLHESIGISAMHMQLLHDDNLVIFDRTDFGPSNLSLPNGTCRYDTTLVKDCTAHSVMYHVTTNRFRPLTVRSDTWCSSGAVLSNGTLLQTGGFNDGDHVVRALTPCSHVADCDWVEFPRLLSKRRWYASNQILPDGRVIIVGGRAQFNYEIYEPENRGRSVESTRFNFLRETKDRHENNLYPFLHLLPDGNLFVFANRKSVLFEYKRNRVVRRFPAIPGGESRNYPSSGSSVLLPLDETAAELSVEVMICGGAPHNSFAFAREGTFLHASTTCGRMRISDKQPNWEMENMPMARVMGDMVILPNGDVIIINGAGAGLAGWEYARNPVLTPLIYRPSNTIGSRFLTMAAAGKPRLYHSTAVLVADGRVLVGGSNPHVYYNFSGVDFPTDLSLESFSPPYLSPEFDRLRPRIVRIEGDENPSYKRHFSLIFRVDELREEGGVSVRIIAPSFNTHSYSMNQRMVVLKGSNGISCVANGTYRVEAFGPSTREIAPPGYYLLFLVHVDVPSTGIWVKIQ